MTLDIRELRHAHRTVVDYVRVRVEVIEASNILNQPGEWRRHRYFRNVGEVRFTVLREFVISVRKA